MRILVAHNAYQQRGGEDLVFETEASLLEKSGHTVSRFIVNNDHIVGIPSKVKAAFSVLNNKDSLKKLEKALDNFKPDVVHLHNFFPTLSPVAIECVVKRDIPIVFTLHNFRPICAGALLMRNGAPCEACVGKSRWPGIVYRCYRGSVVGSACVSLIGTKLKSLLNKYPNLITLVALTEFAKSRYVADGFPEDRIVVKGNCLKDAGKGTEERDRRIVYVGRISEEKGVETLLDAALPSDITLEIIGDGPDRQRLESIEVDKATFCGALPSSQVLEKLKTAAAIVIPSRWYEGFPMVVLEAMATGTPIIASDIGSLGEIIEHEKTGLLVDPYNPQEWNAAISSLVNDTERTRKMGKAARKTYEDKYSEKAGLDSLLAIFEGL